MDSDDELYYSEARDNIQTYIAEPTAVRFHASPARVRGVKGPIGTGKSVMCVAEILRLAAEQKPWVDGVRRSRGVAIRNSYPELKSTTIKTWQDWVPAEVTQTKFDAPIVSVVRFPLPDGTKVELEMLFLSMDKPKDVRKLKSLEVTFAWLNEASELPKFVLDMITGRIGRYPGKKMGGFARDCVIMDTNPPDDDHWWYELAEDEKPRGYEFFTQPPAVLEVGNGNWVINPKCENINGQPKGADYWLDQIPGKTRQWIRVFLQGFYGSVEDGSPVWPEFNPDIHVSERPLAIYEGLPLLLGWDFGRTPACVVAQLSARGQLRILREFYAERMGIREFASKVVRPYLRNHFDGMRVISFGDPSGAYPGDKDDTTCIDILGDLGIPTEPTHTNDFLPRQQAVADFMLSLTDGQPALILDPSIKMVRKGMAGRYKYRRMQVPGEELYSDKPVKNKFSHPCFVAGTGISTPDGIRLIESLRAGDVVDTPMGCRSIRSAFHRSVGETVRVVFSNGASFVCTPDHPIWTPHGFVRADELEGSIYSHGDSLWKFLFRLQRIMVGRDTQYSSFEGSATTGNRPDITKPIIQSVANIFIGQSGRRFLGIFRTGVAFITRTRTRPIISRPISNSCLEASIQSTTFGSLGASSDQCLGCSPLELKPSSGAETIRQQLLILAGRGAKHFNESWMSKENPFSTVSSVAVNTRRSSSMQSAGSVRQIAKRHHGARPAWMMKIGRAAYAGLRFALTNTLGRRRAHVVALERLPPAVVYNIEVEDAHCYFAERILVSNCEATQYLALGATTTDLKPREEKPRPPPNWRA